MHRESCLWWPLLVVANRERNKRNRQKRFAALLLVAYCCTIFRNKQQRMVGKTIEIQKYLNYLNNVQI